MSQLPLYQRLDDTRDAIDRQGIARGGTYSQVCRVVAPATTPEDPQVYFKVVAQKVSGPLAEGSAASFADQGGSFTAFNLGTGIPPGGTKVIVSHVAYRPVFRYDGVAPTP